jgi:chitodextrinase
MRHFFLLKAKILLQKSIIICAVLVLVSVVKSYATSYYVALNGNDNSNNGTSIASPFQTIQKASNLAVAGDIVYVRTGVYREMVDIKSDGVIYQPYNGETVTINGADLMTSWTPTLGTTYQTTMSWDVDAVWGTNQVFSDGKMLQLARWPKQLSDDIVMPTNAIAENVTASGNNFIIRDDDFNEPASRWVGAKIWVNLSRNGYDGQGWTGTVSAISSGAITVNFGEAPRLGNEPWSVGSNTEYYLFDPTLSGVNSTGGVNALLSNGEWWKNGNTLYVKTPDGGTPSSLGTGKNSIEAKKRHFAFWASVTKSGYTITGFNLFGCAITTDKNAVNNRIIIEAAHDITIDGIIAKYVSHQTNMSGNWQDQHYNWSGIVVSGRNNVIKNCNIQFSATSALSISGFGNKALNNTVSNANYMCSNAGAVNTGFVCKNAELANNTIYNTTVMAINIRAIQNDDINKRDVSRVHHNKIYDFMRRSGDSGGIDLVAVDGQWTRIDHNIIYTTKPVFGDMVHGIYLDYGGGSNLDQGRYTVDHNVIFDLPAPILLNSINNINIFNNVLLSNTNIHSIEGGTSGLNVKIQNNIFNKPLRIASDNLQFAIISNNINKASGAVINTLFANAAGANFNLIASATDAIDKGVSVGVYDENIVGLPDIGAYEFAASNDVIPPTKPGIPIGKFVTPFTFTTTWPASEDMNGVAYYEVYSNGEYIASTTTNSYIFAGVVPASTYQVSVRAKDAAGNFSPKSDIGLITTLNATNIALTGAIGYRWAGNTASNNNSNRVQEFRVNDGDLNTTFSLSGGTDYGGWKFEAAGVLFNNIQNNISSVNFIQGDIVNGNTCFTNWLSMQYTKDGTVWQESFWAVNPFYPYGNKASAGKTYVFSGPELFGVKGVRVSGIVFTNDSSWQAYLKEVRVYKSDPTDKISPTIPLNLTASNIGPNSFTLQWKASTDNIGVAGYEVFKNNISIGKVDGLTMNITGLLPNSFYSITVRAFDTSENYSAQSDILNIPTGNKVNSGTGYYWQNLSTAVSNTSRVIAPVITDNDLITELLVPDNFSPNQWQAVGVIWNSPKSNITKLEYFSSFNDGSFTSDIGIQYTTNGSNWMDATKWVVSPNYPYNNTVSGKTFIFSGPPLPNCIGIRVVGQVLNNGSSRGIKLREIRVFNYKNVLQKNTIENSMDPDFELNSVKIFPNPASSSVNIHTPSSNTNISICNMSGTILQNIVTNNIVTTINIANWSKGIYLVKIHTPNEVVVKKLVIIK